MAPRQRFPSGERLLCYDIATGQKVALQLTAGAEEPLATREPLTSRDCHGAETTVPEWRAAPLLRYRDGAKSCTSADCRSRGAARHSGTADLARLSWRRDNGSRVASGSSAP